MCGLFPADVQRDIRKPASITMKCLLLSTFEQQGGAARSAHRLHQGLRQQGIDSRMLVQYKDHVDDSLVSGPIHSISKIYAGMRPYLDALPLLLYRSRLSPPWSLAWLPNNIASEVASIKPDLIHLHGVGHGFLPLTAISTLPGPLVWTLHDSWAFTGGCHLPGYCEQYRESCGWCPQLNTRHECDLSRWGWKRKSECWPKLDVTFVAPSRWMARSAQSSSLLRGVDVDVIPNGVDVLRFFPAVRADARAALGLPHDGLIVLYGAASFLRDENKGFRLLKEALKQVSGRFVRNSLTIVLFGDAHCRETEIAGIPVRTYGAVTREDELIALYRAADCFVLPSLQESLSYTVMEAMACGTPCVAFDVGGVGDLLSHAENGYFAAAGDVRELAEGIVWMLADETRRSRLGCQARKTIENGFSLDVVTKRYLALYERVLASRIKVFP